VSQEKIIQNSNMTAQIRNLLPITLHLIQPTGVSQIISSIFHICIHKELLPIHTVIQISYKTENEDIYFNLTE
jgi:hypothetical protein